MDPAAKKAERYYLLLALLYKKCQGSLYTFVKEAWGQIDPTPFGDNWHIKAMCEQLEQLYRGEITKLIINIPPGCSKSMIASVMFPTWAWLQDPTIRMLTGSHSASLATRDASKARTLINSPWFQAAWGPNFQWAGDQNQKTRYQNNKGGYRIVFGFGSNVTGDRGDWLIMDDPHDAQHGTTEVELRNVLDFYTQVLSTRLNPEGARQLLIMQRLHMGDLTGHLLKKDGWTLFRVPMEYETADAHPMDPRTTEGELLDAKRFTAESVSDSKNTLGEYGAAGQLQQRPSPKGGGLIRTDLIERLEVLPGEADIAYTFECWDTAATDTKTNAAWAGGFFVVTKKGKVILADMCREWMKYHQGKLTVGAFYDKHKPTSGCFIENKSTGQALLGEKHQDPALRGRSLLAWEPGTKDKVTRVEIEATAIEAGNVAVLVGQSWVYDAFQEWANFPNAATADMSDMLAMGLNIVREKATARPQIINLLG